MLISDHTVQVSDRGDDYIVDPINDTRLSHCHAMLHRRNPPLSIDDLQLV